MSKKITFSPSANPELEEGLYKACITNIRHIEYGEDKGSMLELTFRLVENDLILDSRLYMPKKFSAGCQHRLWHFCQTIGFEAFEIIEDPDVAVGCKLVLEVTTIHPTTTNYGHPYSDVKRFLPPQATLCDQETDDATKKTAV